MVRLARVSYIVNGDGTEVDFHVHDRVSHGERPVLVYDGHLSPSVGGSGYFDAVIPAGRLLGR